MVNLKTKIRNLLKNFISCVIVLHFAFCILHANGYAEIESDEELRLYLGEVKIISVNNPTRIAIGNPNIADVVSVSRNEITLSSKAAGSTTLVFWDNFGEQSYRIKVFSEEMNEIKRRVDNLLQKLNLPQVYTQAEEEEGKVLLLGRVKTAQDRERIFSALGTLKDKIADLLEIKEEEAVVEIDVQILELNKDATKVLGFTWPGTVTLTEKGSPGIADAGVKWSDFSKLFQIVNLSRAQFSWTLDALVQEGKARILSRPRLACQSGKEAELLVGGEKPIMTTEVSEGSTGTSVDYKEYGIKLKIKPTVNEEDQIKVALSVEVSEVGTADTLGSSGSPTAKAYPLIKRSASTELFLNDGQTMAIGGLIKQKTEEDIRKTPGLGDVPLLGLFFRKKSTKLGGGQGERGDSELFITLTPTIITPKETKETKEVKTKIVPSLIKEDFSDDPIAGYANIIQKRIVEKLAYPASAKAAGFQGKVKLSLHLSYRGELLETKIKDSSGYKILDDNAISTAKGIVSYPPFPSVIEEKELWIDIPIAYHLN